MIAASLGVAGAQTVLAARDAAAPDDVGAPAALVYLIAGEPGPSEQARLTDEIADLRRHNGPLRDISEREHDLASFPKDAAEAGIRWARDRDAMQEK